MAPAAAAATCRLVPAPRPASCRHHCLVPGLLPAMRVAMPHALPTNTRGLRVTADWGCRRSGITESRSRLRG